MKYCVVSLFVIAISSFLSPYDSLAQTTTLNSHGNGNANVISNYGTIIVRPNISPKVKSQLERAVPRRKNFANILLPGNDTVKANQCAFSTPKDVLDVELGGGPVIACAVDHCVVLATGDEPILSVTRAQHGFLSLDAKVFGPDGRILATVERNKFYINRNTIFRFERPDVHTLEVIDDRDRTALNVRFLNRHTMRVEGRLYGPGGNLYLIDPSGITAVAGKMKTRSSGGCALLTLPNSVGFELH